MPYKLAQHPQCKVVITYYTQDHTGEVNRIDSPMIRRVNVRFMRAVVKAALLFILLLRAHVILCITCTILRRYTIWGYMPLTPSLFRNGNGL